MKRLKEHEPESDFFFIIGGDMIDMLSKWYKINELQEIVTFVGVDRPGAVGQSAFPVTKVAIPEIDLSSTLIRQRVETSGTIQFLVPDAIATYIRQEGLYGSREFTD